MVGRKVAGASVFKMPVEHDLADMLRAELSEAREEWLSTFSDPQECIERDASDFLKAIDSEGERIDLHALRHTTASWLIQSGADVKTVQVIMRHSDIRLTMDKYGHLFPGSEAAAVERMRSVFLQPGAMRKTGTSDQPNDRQRKRQQSGIFGVRNGASMFIESAEQVATRFGQELSPETQNPQEKPEDSEERLRWELNPRWRICNPLP